MGRKSIAVRCPGVKHNCINRLVSNWPLVVFIMVPPWDAKPVAADPPWLGLGLRLGLELEPELRPEFLPPPAALLDNFPTIQTSHGAKHHLPRSDDRPRRWPRKITDGRVFDSSFPRQVDV